MKLSYIPNQIYMQCRYLWNNWVRRITIDSAPTFIVGCGHSGTSLLLSILDAHPRIYSVPFESGIAKGEKPKKFLNALKKFNVKAVVAGKRRVVEKTPKHIQCIGKILKWAPEAKIIIIVRDGRDVAYSIKQRTGSLEEGIQRWMDDNLSAKEFWNHPNVYLVKYEQIIEDFEGSLTGILSHLGEAYDATLRDYHKTKKSWYSRNISKPENTYGENHRQNRNWQINQPLFDSRQKWKNLSDTELSYVIETGQPLLEEFGYIDPKNG